MICSPLLTLTVSTLSVWTFSSHLVRNPTGNVQRAAVGACGYSGFHTSRRPITGWAHTPIIVVRSRINSREDVGGRARGQSHSSHKWSSQSLLITRSMYVTSSTGFHCRLPPSAPTLSPSLSHSPSLSPSLPSYSYLQHLIVSLMLTRVSPLSSSLRPCRCISLPLFWLMAVLSPGVTYSLVTLCAASYCFHLSAVHCTTLC